MLRVQFKTCWLQKMLTLEEIFHGYGLLVGLTSYRLANERYQQSKLTQTYAVILNVFVMCTLPFFFWDIAGGFMMMPWLPGMMVIVPCVICMVSYTVIGYILVSRFNRDSMLPELLDLSHCLTRKMERGGLRTNPLLRRLLHLKFCTFAYLNFVSVVMLLLIEPRFINAFLVNLAFSILHLTTYFHFVSFWQIARGYDFLNQQLGSGRTLDEGIRNLWSLHSLLGRMAHRINRTYGLQMVGCRLEYIIFTTFYCYVGFFFMNKGGSLLGVHATSLVFVRTLDFFLNDFLCELTFRYQCQPKDALSEGIMSQELSDFMIYESSLKQNLKVCGLYSANRKQWLRMISFIICSFTLLMQFYLILTENN